MKTAAGYVKTDSARRATEGQKSIKKFGGLRMAFKKVSFGKFPLISAALIVTAANALFTPSAQAGDQVTEVAITIDDLPIYEDLPSGVTREDIVNRFIQVLNNHGIPGVFGFVNGGRMSGRPEYKKILENWVSAGFRLGNHTFSHMNLEKVTAEDFIRDIEKNEPLLDSLSPNANSRWLRYPFLAEGETQEKRDKIRTYLFSRGYKIVPATYDFYGYGWNQPYIRCLASQNDTEIASLEQTYIDAAIAQLGRSNQMSEASFSRRVPLVLLMHIGAFDAHVLDKLLTALEQRGVKWVSLEATQRDGFYSFDPTQAVRGRRNFLDQVLVYLKKKTIFMDRQLTRLASVCLPN